MEKSYGEAYTVVWNAFHDSEDHSNVVVAMRNSRSRIDRAIAHAYGFQSIDLTCDFIERSEGVRFTISELARREVLQRLLTLNHERYAEEVKQGLHGKKGAGKRTASKKKAASKPAKQEASLFDGEDDE